MASEMIIRRAENTDIPAIRHLAYTIWPAVYDPIIGPAQVKYMLNLFYSEQALLRQFGEEEVFLLGFPDGKAVTDATAVAYASYQPDRKAAGVYKIPKLYVNSSLRGKGIGRKMLDAITGEVDAAGGEVLRLNVNRRNPALSFYKKYGFAVTGGEDTAIGEGYFMNDFVMEKQLGSPYPAGKRDTSGQRTQHR